jgi:hypothetical protein
MAPGEEYAAHIDRCGVRPTTIRTGGSALNRVPRRGHHVSRRAPCFLLSIQTASRLCFLTMGPQVAPPFPAQSHSGLRKRVCGLPGCQAAHQPGFRPGREGDRVAESTDAGPIGRCGGRAPWRDARGVPAREITHVGAASPQARRLVPRTASAAHEDWLGLSCRRHSRDRREGKCAARLARGSVRPEQSCNGNPS